MNTFHARKLLILRMLEVRCTPAKSLVNHGFPGKSGESGLPENQENQALPDYQSG